MPTEDVIRRETYCTSCQENVTIADAVYVRLANGRAIIKGKCSRCGSELIKASIMPKSSALTLLRKKRRKRDKKALPIS
jgi:ribosomal protein S27AE